jgi:tricarboxylate carrier
MWLPGRMSFCVPGNMFISGGMLTFYTSTPAVIFWQVSNQSFNAVVNFVNRNASSEVSNAQLAASYCIGTGAATGVALGLNKLVGARPKLATSVVGRLVPFAAVASANAINIPFMRMTELSEGISITDYDRRTLADEGGAPILSTSAAETAVSSTLISRVVMAIPGMTFPPILTHMIHQRTNIMRRHPILEVAFQIVSCGAAIAFALPFSMALFPQESSLAVKALEPTVQAKLKAQGMNDDDLVYFNKGL